MKYTKSGKNIKISELSITPDIRNFIACQIPMIIRFNNMSIEMGSLTIGNRSIINSKNMIEVNDKLITRDECIKQIAELCQDGIPEILVDANLINTKTELFEILKQSKQINKQILFDGILNFENGMFSIFTTIAANSNKKISEIYFWSQDELNKEPKPIYYFTGEGAGIHPNGMPGKTIEKLLF